VAHVTCHSTILKNGQFGALFKNLWQLMILFMVLFQFIPKSGIFGGFKLLGTPEV